ncbi:putative lipoprotein/thioderoxin [Flavobacteriales bacterium ALC-1]|nr:putative lipoprotein/thioderoxin [Flavobacteriales bacterium ALC-1]
MKRILTIAIIGLLLTACKTETRTGYVINGNAKDVYNGVRVYLKFVDERGEQVVADTAIVMNEEFKIIGSIDEPSVRFLSVDGTQGELIFMLENSEIDIDINKANIMTSVVKGSETNNDFQKFQDEMAEIRKSSQITIVNYRNAIKNNDLKKKDSIRDILEGYSLELANHALTYTKENNDAYFSLNLIGLELNKPKIDVKAYIDAFENLTPRLKDSPKGKETRKKLDELYEAYQKIAHLEIGKVAPNFEAPTQDGDMVSLDDLKGKVTIIDFWAAWCGPCRKENPNVVRVYNKFHDQGLEIIGVSLDGDRRQKDPKKAWLDAIKKDNLTWNHVSNLQYFEDPVAKLYNISSIPATYILDKDGKIAYKNLRGKALELKVEELLNQ